MKFTFERLLDPATGADAAFLLQVIDEIQIIDDYTIRIKTSAPFSPILAHLAHPVAAILNEKAVTEAGADYGLRVAVGTGPFRFVDWVTQSHVTLVRYRRLLGRTGQGGAGSSSGPSPKARSAPSSWKRAASTSPTTWSPSTACGLSSIPTSSCSRPKACPPATSASTCRSRRSTIRWSARPSTTPLTWTPLVEVIYAGQAAQAFGPLSPKVFGAHTDLEPYPYDPQRARELLAQAGYPNGFRTSIWTNDNPLRIQIAEVLQQNLADIGVQADVEVVEWGAYLENTGAGLHDMFILGWVTVTADADYGLYALFHSSQHGSAGNRTFYTNDRVDELLDYARSTSDPDARLAAYLEVQEILREEAPWVFLLFPHAH